MKFQAVALVFVILATAVTLVSATAPPHGEKFMKKADPRRVANHTLAEPIEHVFDVKSDYLRHYMRPVKGIDNRMTLLVLYSSWCDDVCNKWVPVLKELALLTREAQITHRLTLIKHDVTENDVVAQKLKIEALPAIGLVEAADHRQWNFIQYKGAPSAESVVSFIEQNFPGHAQEAHQKLRQAFTEKK